MLLSTLTVFFLLVRVELVRNEFNTNLFEIYTYFFFGLGSY